MCWKTRKKDVKIITACKDIAVYKFLLKKDEFTYVSPYRDYEYKLGQLYTLEDYNLRAINSWDGKVIHYGFHSYSSGCKVKFDVLTNKVYVCSFHEKITIYSSIFLDWYYKKIRTRVIEIVKCIIPKGSRFCVNEDGEIVSNQIIIDSEIMSIEDFINSSGTFKMSSFGEMTTKNLINYVSIYKVSSKT